MTKIFAQPPQALVTSQILTPESQNENMAYAMRAFEEANARRVMRWTDCFLFGASVASGYTSSDATATRRFYLPPGDERGRDGYTIDVIVERIAITANYTATAALTLSLFDGVSSTKQISIPAETTSTDTFTFTDLDSFVLPQTSTSEPYFELSGSGTWTITRMMVEVSYRSDRYDSSGVTEPTLSFPLIQDQDTISSSQALDIKSDLETAASTCLSADFACHWMSDTFHSIQLATNTDFTTSTIPVIPSGTGIAPQAVRLYGYCTLDSAGAVGQTVTIQLIVAGTTITTLTLNPAGVTFASGSNSFAITELTGTAAQTVTVTVDNLGAGATDVVKAGWFLLLI